MRKIAIALAVMTMLYNVGLAAEREQQKAGAQGEGRGRRPRQGRQEEGREGRGGRRWNREDIRRMREQREQRQLQMLREQLQVQSDEEWQILQERIQQVQNLQRARMQTQFTLMRSLWTRGRAQQQQPAEGEAEEKDKQPEVLAKADDAARKLGDILGDKQATEEEIMRSVEAYRKGVRQIEEEIDKAQAKLKELISPRQEAVLVGFGVLD